MPDPIGTEFGSLYPFLSGGTTSGSTPTVMAADSSRMKIREIVSVRQRVAREDGARLQSCAADIAARLRAGGRLLTFGNGGSSTDAQDMARVFVWPGRGRPALPAIALTNDIAAITALTNDIGFDVAFARQLAAFGRRGDVAVGLSTSGNSPNLLAAFDQAKRTGMLTVGLSGADGGKMAEHDGIDYLFVMPSSSVHRIQEAQTTVYHVLWELTLGALAEPPDAAPSGADLPAQSSPASSGNRGGDPT